MMRTAVVELWSKLTFSSFQSLVVDRFYRQVKELKSIRGEVDYLLWFLFCVYLIIALFMLQTTEGSSPFLMDFEKCVSALWWTSKSNGLSEWSIYRVRKENDYNYINLYHSGLRGCRGQISLETNEYSPKLLRNPLNIFLSTLSNKWLNFLSDGVKISHAHIMQIFKISGLLRS